jgi:preprotein translocase subunit Sec63
MFVAALADATPNVVDAFNRVAKHKPLTLINSDLLLKWLAGTYKPKVQVTGAKTLERNRLNPFEARQDPYSVLRVNRGATRDEIKAAYRREIAQYHPDKVAQLGSELRELANEKSKQINEAYSTLMG